MQVIEKYLNIGDDEKLNFSDVYNLVYIYDELDEECYKNPDNNVLIKRKEYVYHLVVSLLKELKSKYDLKDYLYNNFEGSNTGSFISYLFMLRRSMQSYLYTFSGDLVGNRRYIHEKVDSHIRNQVEKIKISHDSTFNIFVRDLLSIDKIISECIGENFSSEINFGILKKNLEYLQ